MVSVLTVVCVCICNGICLGGRRSKGYFICNVVVLVVVGVFWFGKGYILCWVNGLIGIGVDSW